MQQACTSHRQSDKLKTITRIQMLIDFAEHFGPIVHFVTGAHTVGNTLSTIKVGNYFFARN
jgi:hypothetical protein